jgi:hypothetical protein
MHKQQCDGGHKRDRVEKSREEERTTKSEAAPPRPPDKKSQETATDAEIAAIGKAWRERKPRSNQRRGWLPNTLIRGLQALAKNQWAVDPVALITLLPERDKNGDIITNHYGYIVNTAKAGTDRPYWVEGAQSYADWLKSITPDSTPEQVRKLTAQVGKKVE